MSATNKKAVIKYLRSHSYQQTAERFDLSVGKVFAIECAAISC